MEEAVFLTTTRASYCFFDDNRGLVLFWGTTTGASYFFKRQHRQRKQREEQAQLRMSQSDIQHRQLRLLLQQKSCLCCYCCYYISVVFQNPQAKNSSKNLKWQPAFRLEKVVFVVVNRQHRVHNHTVVPVVYVVVKTKA